jgi:hypothetical protein
MTLPAIRWIASLQASGQNCFGIGASATRDSSIDKLSVWVLFLEDGDHRVEAGSLAASCPPGKNFYLVVFSFFTASEDEGHDDQDGDHGPKY